MLSAALFPLAGCASSRKVTLPTPAPFDSEFAALEEKYDVRLGVFARDSLTGSTLAYRADDRFAYCSTYKALAAAAVLGKRSIPELDEIIHYTREDLVSYSPITEKFVDEGMTIRALCDAAVRFSDNTAGNLLFNDVGGPAGLNEKLRALGDTVTQMNRLETALNSAIPGELLDTSSPRALATDLDSYALGDGLPIEKQTILKDWLAGNATGDQLIRAGVPEDWKVEDKSGAGDYGTRNDIGIVYPTEGGPVSIAVLSTRTTPDAEYDNKVIAEATRVTFQHLTRD